MRSPARGRQTLSGVEIEKFLSGSGGKHAQMTGAAVCHVWHVAPPAPRAPAWPDAAPGSPVRFLPKKGSVEGASSRRPSPAIDAMRKAKSLLRDVTSGKMSQRAGVERRLRGIAHVIGHLGIATKCHRWPGAERARGGAETGRRELRMGKSIGRPLGGDELSIRVACSL